MSMPLRWEEPPSQEPVDSPQSTPKRRRRTAPIRRMIGATLILTLALSVGTLTTIGAQSVWNSVRPAQTLRLDARPGGSEVSTGLPAVERHLGFVTITGSIASHVDRPLAQVEAVVELLDSQNQTVQLESGLIAFDPLMPGQTAPFRVDLPDNTRAVAYRIRFRQLSGAALD
jgi:hypothetical protein